jgi:uncharacterized membrane protein YphA (DoxX/SURF4 family)
MKFAPNGALLYSTFLGGPNYDRAYAIELDASGNIYIAGRAGAGFPASPGSVQPKFAGDVSNYRLLPHEMINLVAILIPWVEVVAGLLVLAGVWLRAAALVITSMTVMFFVVITSALARGLNIECGCFGTVGGKNVGLTNLVIDSTLFCLAALLVWRSVEKGEITVLDAGQNAIPQA